MSAAASTQPPATPDSTPDGGAMGAAPAVEACPLCGTPLQPEQEWCLSCGAAARTRLAAAPNWRAPIVVAAVIAALALGVLAAALVKLAGDSGPAPAPRTHTVTAAGAPLTTSPAVTSTLPAAPQTGAGAGTTPGAATAPPTRSTAPGTVTPGAATAGTHTPTVTGSKPGSTTK